MLGWRVPDPDEAMLIAGGKVSDDAPFKVITGKGAWVMPGLRHVSFLSLMMREAEITEQCVTKQGIEVGVRAVIAFKVGNNPESITAAGQRFISDESQMEKLVGRVFAGHLRNIVGTLTVEEIITERQKLADAVVQGSSTEMGRLGLVVDALQIQSIDDLGSEYIKNMAAPHNAAIKRQAAIAQAEADKDASRAQQQSAREQAEFERDTEKTKAEYTAQVNEAQATASQAGPLAEAQAQKDVVKEQAALAQQTAELTEQQLQSSVIKPAKAKAEETEIQAHADAANTKTRAEGEASKVKTLAAAEATKVREIAEATASSDRVSLDQTLIEQLPDIVKAAGEGLAHADVTVFNGTDGMADMAAGLLAQGMRIYNTVKTAQADGSFQVGDTRGREPQALKQ